MPFDPTPHLAPAKCALILFELQERIIGAGGPFKGLLDDIAEKRMLPKLAQLLAAARAQGVLVVYCNMAFRPDGLGAPITPRGENSPRGAPGPGVASPVVAPLTPLASEVVLDRIQGMSCFTGTPLQAVLRARKIETLILTGVSLNIGIPASAVEALGNGYRVVVARDGAAGDPPSYARDVLKNTLNNLAYLTTCADIARTWGAAWSEPA
jgi:nicotinamidase-related amidase